MATKKNLILELTPEEQTVLQLAMEFYIRMGLGQFSEIAQRLNLLYGDRIGEEKMDEIRRLCEELEDGMWDEAKQWDIKDPETSLYVLTAFLLDSKLTGNAPGVKYANKRIEEIKKKGKEQIQ
jgi:hypothetical protein